MTVEPRIAVLEAGLAAHLESWWRHTVTGHGTVCPLPGELLAQTRGTGPWWRLAIAAAVEADADVRAAVEADMSWRNLGALAHARDGAARALGFDGYEALAVAALGSGALRLGPSSFDAPLAGARDLLRMSGVGAQGERHDDTVPEITIDRLRAILITLATRHAVDARSVRIDRAAPGQAARTFVIAPGRDVRVVVSGGRTLAAWREALHELGHGLVGATGRWPPRTVDESVATWASDRLTDADEAAWIVDGSIAAAARRARARRRRGAAFLARFEASLYADPTGDLRARFEAGAAAAGFRRDWPAPPRPLWHDPGAQGAYHAAEGRAVRLADALGLSGALADAMEP